MKDYIICTDSACDLRPDVLEKWNVPYVNLTFHFEGDSKDYIEKEISISDFYNKMREGEVAKTSAVNPDAFKSFFETFVKEGKDVLYLAFSSGLSTTYNSAKIAAEEVEAENEGAKVIVIDSLCASAGQALLLKLMLEKQQEGATIEENAQYTRDNVLHICHWFTVNDLVYLKRGGRVSPAVALAGAILGIKPILHVDNEGHLINVGKVRGRKSALEGLIKKYEELAINKNGRVFISNADCLDEANDLKATLENKYGANVEVITEIGPVIGAHAGPGTMAVFFLGKER